MNHLYILSKNEFLRILMTWALFQRDKLSEHRPEIAQVQAKQQGLISLGFAQLGPVPPSEPSYLPAVYLSI